METYDLIILGGGPAGLMASIYARRYNMKTLVIAKKCGGTALQAGEVKNWPGFSGSGKELMNMFREEAEKLGAELMEDEVEEIKREESEFVVSPCDKKLRSKAIIIATGTENRRLDIEGEKELLGRGISYASDPDKEELKGKSVVIIGGSDSAAKIALSLSTVAKEVMIIYRKSEMRCEPAYLEELRGNDKIKIIGEAVPLKAIGEDKLESLEITVDGEKMNLKADYLIVAIGAAPVVDIIKSLSLKTEKNYIVTDNEMRTNAEGVFAAGDITNNPLKQIVTAAAEGAVAAKSTYNYLNK